MKDVYAKLREEHIDTLKKQGVLQKELEEANKTLMDSEDGRRHAEQDLSSLRLEKGRAEELRLQSANEAEGLSGDMARMRQETEQLIVVSFGNYQLYCKVTCINPLGCNSLVYQ